MATPNHVYPISIMLTDKIHYTSADGEDWYKFFEARQHQPSKIETGKKVILTVKHNGDASIFQGMMNWVAKCVDSKKREYKESFHTGYYLGLQINDKNKALLPYLKAFPRQYFLEEDISSNINYWFYVPRTEISAFYAIIAPHCPPQWHQPAPHHHPPHHHVPHHPHHAPPHHHPPHHAPPHHVPHHHPPHHAPPPHGRPW